MTVSAPQEVNVERPVPATGGVRRWWRSWRVALRLARRDAWRDKWRSLLVVVLIFAPVAVLTSLDVYYRTSQVAETGTYRALLGLGREADAKVVASYDGPVVQSPDALNFGPAADIGVLPDIQYPDGTGISSVPGDDGTTPPSARPTSPRFPTGWQVVPQWRTNVTVLVDKHGWSADAVAIDTRYPLAAARFDVSSGRLPNGTGEVAVSRALAAASGVEPGSRLTVVRPPSEDDPTPARVQLAVVGIADATDQAYATSIVMAPGPLTASNSVVSWLVDTPDPLSWQDVRALNAQGLAVASRAVLSDPPSFCQSGQLCLDAGPAREFPEGAGGISMRAQDVAVGAMVAVLALLQVALLAGPAFAVSLRRRQRDLALVAANGGTGADLRRSILSSAVVLGVVSGIAAVVVAVAGVRFAAPWLVRWGNSVPLPAPVLRPEVLAIAAVAVVAALAAAFVPARIAARTDVLHALRGRRPSGPVRRSVTWGGLGLVLLGSALIVWGTVSLDPVTLVGGVLALQVGIIALVPWLVTIVGRLGAHLPITLRVVTRDGVRSRLRTVSAVSAITAASVGSCVALIATASYATGSAHFYLPRAQPGTVLVQYYGDAPTATVRAALQRAAPSASVSVAEMGRGSEAQVEVEVWLPGCDLRMTPNGSGFDSSGRYVDLWADPDPTPELLACRAGSHPVWWDVVRADATWLAAVAGPLDPGAARALEAGHAVALDPTALGPAGVTLLTYDQDRDPPRLGPTVTIPGVALPTDVQGPRVALGPTAHPKGWTFDSPVFALVPASGTDPGQVEAAVRGAPDEVSQQSVDGDPGYSVYVERGYVDDSRLLALAVVAGTGLLALIAALSVTALALSDARPDLGTMAAVGAPPRARRRYAAGTALFVTGLGTLLGIAAGLVPAWAITRTLTVAWGDVDQSARGHALPASDFFTVPWLPLLLLAVGVPLVTAAVAYTFTRSRVPLTRRAD